MPLTTLFGTTQLALQDAMRRNIDSSGGLSRAPNFIVARLRREDFLAEYPGRTADEIGRFKRDLESAMRSFAASHGWSIGGSGTVVVNVLLSDIAQQCDLQARIARSFYECSIQDDQGQRTVQIGSNPATVGRAHEFPTRGFIPVHDARRIVSREHLRLTYADLRLRALLLGRNTTTLNGTPMTADEVELKEGDIIECGSCRISGFRLSADG